MLAAHWLPEVAECHMDPGGLSVHGGYCSIAYLFAARWRDCAVA